MRVGVLAVDLPRGKVGKIYGNYYHMFEKSMRRIVPNLQLTIFPVLLENKLPPLRSLHNFDGFYITGSRHSVHDKLDWIEQLRSWIRAADQQRVKLYGTCFGHQIICQALGGAVEKNAKGIHLGLKETNLTKSGASLVMSSSVPSKVNLVYMHSDHVVALPPGGVLLGSNRHCGVLGMVKGSNILTLQGHPEVPTDVVRLKAEEKLATGLITEEQAREALLSVVMSQAHSDLLNKTVARFFLGSRYTDDGLRQLVSSTSPSLTTLSSVASSPWDEFLPRPQQQQILTL